MPRTYTLSPQRKLANWLMRALLQLGVTPSDTYLLTVPGRKSSRPHTTPVTLVEEDGRRWLVAPYGPVNWVWNARAAGRVTLTRGRRSEHVQIEELGPAEAAPILKLYASRVPITRPYFDTSWDAPAQAFEAEAPRHPVFRIVDPAHG